MSIGSVSEETLNHLLSKATVLSFIQHSPSSLHILTEGGSILAIYSESDLTIDILGPNNFDKLKPWEIEEDET